METVGETDERWPGGSSRATGDNPSWKSIGEQEKAPPIRVRRGDKGNLLEEIGRDGMLHDVEIYPIVGIVIGVDNEAVHAVL